MNIVASSINIIIGRIVSMIISFISAIIIARYLSAEDRGILSIYLYTVTFIVIILNAGLVESSIYLLNNGKLHKEAVIKNQILYLFFIACIFFGLAALSINFFSEVKILDFYCLVLIVILMLFNSLFRHYLLAEKKIRTYNISVIFENISYLLFVFLCFFLKLSFTYILLSNLVAQVIVLIFLLRKIRNSLPKFEWPALNLYYIKKSYSLGLHLFITSLGGFGLQRISFFILNYFTGAKSVGLYTIASTLPTIYENLPQQISTIAYTYSSAEEDFFRRRDIAVGLIKLILYCVTFATLPLIIFPEQIMVFIFGNKYGGLGNVTLILTISTIFSSLSGIFYNLLAGIGKPIFGTYLTIINLSVTLITSFFFINNFGLIGAAYSKLISSIVAVIFIGYFFLRHYEIGIKDILIIKGEELNLLLLYFRKPKFIK